MKIKSETTEKMSRETSFLVMEALLTRELERIEEKYGKEIASFTRAMLQGSITSIFINAERFSVDGPKALIAFIETMGAWNTAIDAWAKEEFLRKREC
jgi:hypothetical protein